MRTHTDKLIPPCEGCDGKQYQLATRSDGIHAVERCDTCSINLTDDNAIILAEIVGQAWIAKTLNHKAI